MFECRQSLILACAVACYVIVSACELRADDYATTIKPLFKQRCYACHGALKQEAGLRLDTVEAMRRGGDSGAALIPGEVASSPIWQRITASEVADRMPPEHEGEQFEAEDLAVIQRWIGDGADGPAEEIAERSPREHWSFQTIVRPKIPRVDENLNDWVSNPIDAFVAKQYRAQGLTPNSEASPLLQVRRLFIDLTGLPPNDEELAAAMQSSQEHADWRGLLIETLLSRPQYGERWGRHWMDIWRYSDWWGLGDQLRNSQQHIWHWRDWIVESLNENKPYDEMIRFMLAADEIVPTDQSNLRATGFLARNFFLFNRNQWMDETIEHVGKAFLGLTMNCAKCHDHKYDPISQDDYYRFRAFFEPYHVRLDMVPHQTDFAEDGVPRVFDGLLEAPTYRFVRGDENRPDTSQPISPGAPAFFDFASLDIQPVQLPIAARPEYQPQVLESYLAKASAQVQECDERIAEQSHKLQELTAQDSPPLPVDSVPIDENSDGTSRPEDVTDSQAIDIRDDFKNLSNARWLTSGGDWSLTETGLEQRRDEAQEATLDLREAVGIEDFEAQFRFTIHAGTPYRSVGIAFDRHGEASESNSGKGLHAATVYASAHDAEPKLQIAYRTVGGEWSYPAEGRQSAKLSLGQEIALHVRVRGRLVNAQVNDGPVLAWQLPLERHPGVLSLTTYTAQVTFHHFSLKSLPASVELVDPAMESQRLARLKLERQLDSSRALRKLAESEVAFLQKCIVERNEALKREILSNSNTIEAAVLSQRYRDLARAEYELTLLCIEQVDGKRDAASIEADIAKATERVKQLNEAVHAPIDVLASLEFPQGAKWTPTRFKTSTADDSTVSFQSTSTGRRSALAWWITDPRNPMTARVAVNHIWSRHFGSSLMAAEFDLGRDKRAPLNQELLDWLASELIDSDWDMKHIHRLIVNSATYRLSSSTVECESQMAVDPDNNYLWRRTPTRLESEVVRDSLLFHAGDLQLVLGGASVPQGEQGSSLRRSMYFFHSNNERNPLLTTFDEARVQECYRREQSIVPQQALALSNSQLVLSRLVAMAERFGANRNDSREFIRCSFRLLLGDEPTDEELILSLRAIEGGLETGESRAEAGASLLWALINHHDFVTLR